MAVVADDYPGTEVVIEGRPDFADRRFGVVRAKKHPPYVFSVNANAVLVHKVAYVDMWWWKVDRGGNQLRKLSRPVLIATSVCNYSFRLSGHKNRTCLIPSPDAVLCGRCHGEPASFGPNGRATKAKIKKPEAHVKLGCVVKAY